MSQQQTDATSAPPRGHIRVVYLGPVAPHWRVDSDFGDRNLTFVDRTGSFNYGIKETKSVVKAGLNLRWGALGGPVARY